MDRSLLKDQAIGVCTHCKTSVVFPPNNSTTNCPKCGLTCTRMGATAVSADMQRFGYTPGDPRSRH